MDKFFRCAAIWLLLVGSTGQVFAESRVAFLCDPDTCQVDKFHETGIRIRAGVINKGDSASGDLRVSVMNGPDGKSVWYQGFAYYAETLAPGAQYDSGTELITGYKMPASYSLNEAGETFFSLWLEEKVSEEWTVRDRMTLRPKILIPSRLGGGSTGMRIYLDGRDGNPSIENVGDGEVVIRIPRIVNTSPDPVTISRVVLPHTSTAEFWQGYQVGLDEQNLSITIDAFSTLTNVEVRGSYNEPNSSNPFTHLNLESGSGVEVWQTIEARQGNSITSYPYFAESTDFLVDTDGDGVSDFNENLMGTDLGNSQSQPETVVLDVMALYTPDVAEFYNGEPEARILQELEWGNQALKNSEIDARYRLVETRSVNYTESLDVDLAIEAVRDQEGVFEGIDAVRESVGADLLVIYVYDDPADGVGVNGKCGVGYLNAKGGEGDFGYSERVLMTSALVAGCKTKALAHEFGHNLGLAHDAREESNYGTFDWSRGHAEDNSFATTMAYASGYGVITGDVQYFSNPDIACPGGPCGVDRSDTELGADAALTIRTTMYQASQYAATAEDTDGDGSVDGGDNCPNVANNNQLDTDQDGQGDACDDDDDGDGVPDASDAFPLDASETTDTDGDGIGDNADDDDDGDGVKDSDEDSDGGGSGTSGLTFGGKEYRWIKERKTQEEAQAHAESLGGHLVVINSADEDDFVYSMVRDASLTGLGIASDGGGVSYVWLGGNDAASEGDWVWVNGEPFQYTNWGQAEPDNYLGQDGLAMGLQNWPDGSSGSAAYGLASEWNDISRSNQLTFIVELPSEGESGGSTGSTGGNFSTDFALNYAVSLGPFGGCAIDDGGVECWGTGWITGSRIPSLSNPSQLSIGSSHACALDDTGVVCWGSDNDGKTDVPSLGNPYFIAAKYDTNCALDDTGVVCWGDNSSGQTDVPVLNNPREVALGFHNTCALDDTGIVCWGDDSREVVTDIPVTVNPSKLTMGDSHACVMDNDRVVCWANGFLLKNTTEARSSNQPTLTNPRELVAGGYHVCAIDDQGLKCWGRDLEGVLDLPAVVNPSKVYAAGQFGGCVLDDNGLQCWGSEVSDSNSSREASLEELPDDLSFASSGQRVVTQYLQTTSASQNITTLNVVNSSDRSQTFRGILRSGSGEKVGADEPVLGSDIPSMGRLTLDSNDLETIFGIEPWRGPAMLTIRGDSTFDLMSKLESPSGLVSNTNCVRDNRVLNLEGFDSNNMSYLRLINTGAKTTKAIKGTLYDGNGNVVGNANAELVAKLDPYQQTWINRNQLSSLIGAEWNGEGMLEVNVTPGLKLLNLNFITDESTFFNFSCADKATLLSEPSSSSDPANIGRIYLQTTSTSQNVSLTHLVNTSGSARQYTGTLYASDGTQVGSADQPLHSGTISSKGRLIISSTDIESAFNISPWRGPAILEVKGDGLFELMTKLESPSGLISNTNCVRTEQVHNIGGFDQTDVTYVRFINIGDTPITNIRGSLYDNEGNVVGDANHILVKELPAKSHVWRSRNQLSDGINGRTWNGTVSLKIDNADTNLRLLNLNFINSETFFNFSCYETGQ